MIDRTEYGSGDVLEGGHLVITTYTDDDCQILLTLSPIVYIGFKVWKVDQEGQSALYEACTFDYAHSCYRSAIYGRERAIAADDLSTEEDHRPIQDHACWN